MHLEYTAINNPTHRREWRFDIVFVYKKNDTEFAANKSENTCAQIIGKFSETEFDIELD